MRVLYRFLSVFVASFVALSFSPGAVAQTCTTSWAAPTDGLWTEAANWTNGVPDAASVACITVPGTYTVTVGTTALTVSGILVGGASGVQTLNSQNAFTVTGDGRIGPNGRWELTRQFGTPGVAVGGTLLVEGVLRQAQVTTLLNTGGVLDVAPGGRYEMHSGASAGGAESLFRIRGTLELTACGGSFGGCTLNSPFEVDGGTISLLSGRLDVRQVGSFTDATFATAEGTTLYIHPTQVSSAERLISVAGTLSGTLLGDVYWYGVDVDAGTEDVTLDFDGEGFQLLGYAGRTAELRGNGGRFINVGRFRTNPGSSWGQGVRGTTLVNQNLVELRCSFTLWDDATLQNDAGGTVRMPVDSCGVNVTGDGTFENFGRLLRDVSTASARVQVPYHGRPGSTVEVLAGRLDLEGGGSFDGAAFIVAEGTELWLRHLGPQAERLWTLDGTLSGEVGGLLRWFGSDFAAGPSNPVLAFTGQGLQLAGEFGRPTQLTDGGGSFTNTGLIRLDGSSGWGIGARGGTLVNEGRIELTYPFRFWEDGVLRNEPGGVIQMMNGGFMDTDGQGLVENHGLIERNGNATALSFAGTLRSRPGSELRALTGRLDLDSGDDAVPQGTTVTGTAQIRLVNPLVVGGTLSPGTEAQPIATQEFVTSLQMSPTARTVIDIAADGQSDTIIPASGITSTTLDGTLVVRPAPGFTPSPGDEWTIFVRSANPYDIQGDFHTIEVEGDVPDGVGFVTAKPNAGVVVLRAVSGVTIEALAGSTSEDGPPVRFRITSSQPVPPGSVLSVPLAFEGTAQRYVDYTVDVTGTTARIPGGQTETVVTLFPLRDDLDEGDESVTLRLLPGGDAEPGSPDSATITLQDGPPTSALAVSGIAPTHGGNVGQVSASVFGQGFAEGATVFLQRGGTVIPGTAVLVGEQGQGLTARFDLAGAALGSYDVVVESGGTTDVFANGFTVEASEGLLLWADINGTPNPRQFRWSTYTLTVGNSGNEDLHDTLVLLRVTGGVEYEIDGVLVTDASELPPDPENYGYIGQNVETATVIPVYLYRIPAGGVNTVTVRIRPALAVGTGVGVSYELYPPDPQAAFTWSGDFGVIEQDLDEGHVPNWVIMGGAIAWAHDFIADRNGGDASAGGGGPLREDPSLNNPWDRPREDLSLSDLVDYYANVTNLGDNPMDAAAVTLLAATERGLTLALNPIASLVGLRVAAASGNPWAVGAAAVRLGLSLAIVGSGEQAAGRVVCRFVSGPGCTPPGGPGPGGGSGSGSGSGTGGGSTGGPGGGPAGGMGGGAGGKSGGAVDPNDKLGPAGYGEFRYTTAHQPALYTIRYENLETATFPAQEVVIIDDLDLSVYDLSTFSLGPITLPDRVVTPPPGSKTFSTTLDLAPELPALLVINAALDESSGRVVWTFVTLDPATNDLPEDGLVGFLPPNVEQPEGEGAVSFTVDLLTGLGTNTDVANLAEIFFDLNEPIVTPVWSNRLDRDAPTTAVEPLPAQSESPFTIAVQGADAGSGIQTYALYVSEDDGPFTLAATSIEPTFTFEGEIGVEYAFYSMGLDFVGNAEPPKTEAEAVTTVVTVSTEESDDLPRELTLHVPYPNPMRGAATLRFGLPAPAEVDVRLYDLLGREVARVVDREMRPAGWHETRLAPNLASGVYVLRLSSERDGRTEQRTQRVVIVR